MQGKIERFDLVRGQGEIFFDIGLSFPFDSSGVRGPCLLEKGDPVFFNLKDQGGRAVAFDIQLERGPSSVAE